MEPETGLMDRFCLDNMYSTFSMDSLESSHPISATVQHPDEINEIFDSISYGKGASIIRMMANFLGEEAFKDGLTLYLNKHKYANAAQDDLWQALTEVAHDKGTFDQDLTVKQIMDTWTLQMGFPVVTVTRDYINGTVTLEQDRYLSVQPEKSKDDHDYKWWVPITHDYEGGDFDNTQDTFWLSPTKPEATLDLSANDDKHKALIVNVQQTGYYRVNYDESNWDLISKAMTKNPNSINRVNRGQVLNDAFNLARIGLMTYKQALGLTKYLIREKDYIPWAAALGGFSYIKQMFGRSAGYGLLKNYMITELIAPYRSLGFDFRDEDSFADEMLRESVVSWMCSLGYDDCKSQSTVLFKEWMASDNPDENNPINPALRKTVYCEAIADGDEKEWAFLFRRFGKSNNANEKTNIMRALACTGEVWILQKYLDMSLDPTSGIRKQDGTTVISAIASNDVGRYMTWNWLRNKWDEISVYFDTAISSSVGRIVSSVTKDFNTPFELKELEDFYAEHKDELGTARRTTLNSIEKVKANVQWMDTYYKEIVTWLKNELA